MCRTWFCPCVRDLCPHPFTLRLHILLLASGGGRWGGKVGGGDWLLTAATQQPPLQAELWEESRNQPVSRNAKPRKAAVRSRWRDLGQSSWNRESFSNLQGRSPQLRSIQLVSRMFSASQTNLGCQVTTPRISNYLFCQIPRKLF